MRARYVLSEAALGLWRNVTMTIAMIITMGMSLWFLGGSGLLFLQVDKIRDLYYSQVEVSIFLAPDITDEQRAAIDQSLSTDPMVASYYFESREQAYERFRSLFADSPELVAATDAESLPESFRVRLTDPERFTEISDRYRSVEGISEIVDQQELVGEIFSILNAIQIGALAFAIIMACASALLVMNVITVAAYSRRREVAVMKMVGAPNWFIQIPFVLEAVVAGLIGTLVAFGLLAGGKVFFIDGPLAPLSTVLTPVPWRNILLTLPALALFATILCATTAWFTLFLRLPK
ncbi:MAG TPA: permease-like cell division protein FtsX [Natronosporangium sp.]